MDFLSKEKLRSDIKTTFNVTKELDLSGYCLRELPEGVLELPTLQHYQNSSEWKPAVHIPCKFDTAEETPKAGHYI